MNEYFPNNYNKLNPKYSTQLTQPFFLKKINIKKHNSKVIKPKTIYEEKKNNFFNVIFIKLRQPFKKNTNKSHKLKYFNPIISSTTNKNTYCKNVFEQDKNLFSSDILYDKAFFKSGKRQLIKYVLANEPITRE